MKNFNKIEYLSKLPERAEVTEKDLEKIPVVAEDDIALFLEACIDNYLVDVDQSIDQIMTIINYLKEKGAEINLITDYTLRDIKNTSIILLGHLHKLGCRKNANILNNTIDDKEAIEILDTLKFAEDTKQKYFCDVIRNHRNVIAKHMIDTGTSQLLNIRHYTLANGNNICIDPFQTALKYDNIEVANWLIDKGIDLEMHAAEGDEETNCYYLALRYNHIDIAEKLLSINPKLAEVKGAVGWGYFNTAFFETKLNTVKYMAEQYAKYNPGKTDAIYGVIEEAELISEHTRLATNIHKNTLLEKFKLLVKYTNADPNYQDAEGNTALHKAHTENLIYCLKELGADPNIFNNKKQTPLMANTVPEKQKIFHKYFPNAYGYFKLI